MSGADGGAPWRVELAAAPADELRRAEPLLRRRLADLLDRLAERGLPDDAQPSGGGGYRIRQGDVEAVVTLDTAARRILVARLTGSSTQPAAHVLRAARVPAVPALRIAGHVEELGADVRTALRSFRRSPGFVLSVLATLAVAIGGAATLVGLAGTVFAGALPFEDDHELLRLRDRRVTEAGEDRIFNMSPLDFHAVREQATTLAGVAAAGGVSHVLTGGEMTQRVNTIRVSEGWAELLGLRALVGRLFSPEEERAGPDAQVVLLSHALWETRFGADPGVVGRTIAHDGGVWTVVGVLPPRFHYPYAADVWVPWRWDPSDGTSHDLNVVARMGPGATEADVAVDLARVADGLRRTRPDTNADLHLNVESLRADFIRDDGSVLVALIAAATFLLLLACVNVTNLFVARFVSRRREVGIRAALGAGRLREIRGFMVETVLLFLGGGIVAVALSLWLGRALAVLVPDVMRTQLDMTGGGLSAGQVALTLGLSLVVGVAFGLMAAAKGTRTDVSDVLKDGGRSGSSGGTGIQRVLVATQLALSLALLVGAGVLFQHFQRLYADDLGMRIDGLHTARISLEQERFSEPEARLDIVGRLADAIGGIPGVQAVGYTTVNPLCCGDWGAPLAVEGLQRPEGATHLIHHRLVGPGYFGATGTPLVEGRDFDAQDRPGSLPVVIVDEPLADRFWPGESALGKRVRLDREGSEWLTVVGVVGDVEEEGDYSETWYLPYTQTPTARSTANLHFMIRAEDPDVLGHVRRVAGEVDPVLAVYELRTMASLRAENISQDRLGASVGTVFAAFGLLLAALGVFGMLSYSVGTRQREIGTRIALGAHPGRVTGLIFRDAMKLTAAGAAGGLVLALALNRLLQHAVFGVEAASPAVLALVSLVLVSAAVLAALLPAVRASRVDPIQAFRE